MKKWICIWFTCSLLLVLFGCANQGLETTEVVELPENSILLYRIDESGYELQSEVYTIDPQGSERQTISVILSNIFNEKPENKSNLIANTMKMIHCAYLEEDRKVQIRVNVANELNDEYLQVLAKAAITKTLCQLENVETVEFMIYDSSTPESGVYTEEYDEFSFVDAEEEGGFLQTGVITIYFANEAGDGLLTYDKAVEITNNISLEQLVIESLITGPLRDGYYPTIPEGTTLNRISIKDGVCYVDLSVEFNNTLDTCQDMITIYSVVNSLCELPTIDKVQFLINGERQNLYRETIPLDGMFERQMELVMDPEEENE